MNLSTALPIGGGSSRLPPPTSLDVQLQRQSPHLALVCLFMVLDHYTRHANRLHDYTKAHAGFDSKSALSAKRWFKAVEYRFGIHMSKELSGYQRPNDRSNHRGKIWLFV